MIKIVLGEKITSWEDFRMSITKCPGHMRSLKLNFSATVLTLGLKASFGGNCARAPRLTAVWTLSDTVMMASFLRGLQLRQVSGYGLL